MVNRGEEKGEEIGDGREGEGEDRIGGDEKEEKRRRRRKRRKGEEKE